MKNREKYREEIVRSAKTSSGNDACEFKKTHVLPHFGGDGEGCNGYSCKWCYILCGLWLDEEYIEPLKPEVDWSKVPVDTLVRVRNDEDSPWVLQYFKEFDEERNYKFLAWSNGRTSKTAGCKQTGWQYCELVEDEDGNSSI